jgi:serine/threonine protein kinase
VNEAKIHFSLNNKYIVSLLDFVQTSRKKKYYLMSYYPMGDLRTHLLRNFQEISMDDKSRWFYQTIKAIEYLFSKNVMHRDIKSENLLLSNNLRDIRLADFGFATEEPVSNKLLGTLEYIAPEILLGFNYNYRVDVWSAGILLYEMIFNHTPFSNPENDPHDFDAIKLKIIYLPVEFHRSAKNPEEVLAYDLIQLILRKDPAYRPSFNQMLTHMFTQLYRTPAN